MNMDDKPDMPFADDGDIDHSKSCYPCTKCGATRINTLFFVEGIPFFIHTCVCCDAPSEEPVD